jgi:hypothetical protein
MIGVKNVRDYQLRWLNVLQQQLNQFGLVLSFQKARFLRLGPLSLISTTTED